MNWQNSAELFCTEARECSKKKKLAIENFQQKLIYYTKNKKNSLPKGKRALKNCYNKMMSDLKFVLSCLSYSTCRLQITEVILNTLRSFNGQLSGKIEQILHTYNPSSHGRLELRKNLVRILHAGCRSKPENYWLHCRFRHGCNCGKVTTEKYNFSSISDPQMAFRK